MSIKDVARAAGVSTATVSHVINNTRFVSAETRGRVLRAVEECNYYPNAQARGLVSGRTRILGLIISDITNPFFPELVKSIECAGFELPGAPVSASVPLALTMKLSEPGEVPFSVKVHV